MSTENSSVLELHIKKAKIYINAEMFGKMDPYIKFEVCSQIFRTKTNEDGGQEPQWNETFQVEIDTSLFDLKDEILKVSCFDEDLILDDFLGQNIFKISEIIQNANNQCFPLYLKDKKTVDVNIEAQIREKKQEQCGTIDAFNIDDSQEQKRQTIVDQNLLNQKLENQFDNKNKQRGLSPLNANKKKSNPLKNNKHSDNRGEGETHQHLIEDDSLSLNDIGNFEENQFTQGALHLKVHQAKIYIDTELFGKMDPYIVVEYENKEWQTPIVQDGGTNPVWNHEFTIEVLSLNERLKVSCYDEDFFVHDFLGHAIIDLKELLKNKGEAPVWIPLKSKAGEMTAEVQLRGIFVKKDMNQQQKNDFPIIKDDNNDNNKPQLNFIQESTVTNSVSINNSFAYQHNKREILQTTQSFANPTTFNYPPNGFLEFKVHSIKFAKRQIHDLELFVIIQYQNIEQRSIPMIMYTTSNEIKFPNEKHFKDLKVTNMHEKLKIMVCGNTIMMANKQKLQLGAFEVEQIGNLCFPQTLLSDIQLFAKKNREVVGIIQISTTYTPPWNKNMQIHAINYKLEEHENEQINQDIINHIMRHRKLEKVDKNSTLHKILAGMVKNIGLDTTVHSRTNSIMGGNTTPNIFQGERQLIFHSKKVSDYQQHLQHQQSYHANIGQNMLMHSPFSNFSPVQQVSPENKSRVSLSPFEISRMPSSIKNIDLWKRKPFNI